MGVWRVPRSAAAPFPRRYNKGTLCPRSSFYLLDGRRPCHRGRQLLSTLVVERPDAAARDPRRDDRCTGARTHEGRAHHHLLFVRAHQSAPGGRPRPGKSVPVLQYNRVPLPRTTSPAHTSSLMLDRVGLGQLGGRSFRMIVSESTPARPYVSAVLPRDERVPPHSPPGGTTRELSTRGNRSPANVLLPRLANALSITVRCISTHPLRGDFTKAKAANRFRPQLVSCPGQESPRIVVAVSPTYQTRIPRSPCNVTPGAVAPYADGHLFSSRTLRAGVRAERTRRYPDHP